MRNSSTISQDTKGPSAALVEASPTGELFQWWYRLASPPEPARSASFRERERFRRGRTGSQVVLAVFVVYIAGLSAAIARTDFILVVILSIGMLALITATMLNRMGYVTPAGIVVVITITASPVTDILRTPGGLNSSVFPVYSILVLPLVCAASFLPAWWIFVLAVGNSLFTLYTMIFMHHSTELDATLKVASTGIVAPIILSQLIVAVVAYIWVTGAVRAIKRADRAEEIAQLEHDLAISAEIAAQQKEQLEASIQKIVETHTRVANGDFNARVPLTEDNVLWQVSSSLNNFLSRLQRSRQELQQMRNELEQAREEIRRLKNLPG